MGKQLIMSIDMFVHPDFPFEQTNGDCNTKTYKKYFDALVDRWKRSKLPILVKGIQGHKRFIDAVGKVKHSFNSDSYRFHDCPPIEVGEIRPNDDWNRFEELLESVNYAGFLIHGAYQGECTEGLAVQLFAYKVLGEHWLGTRGKEKQVKKFERNGSFAKCGIKYGVVHRAPAHSKARVIAPSFWRLLPHGNIMYQLQGNATEVHPL